LILDYSFFLLVNVRTSMRDRVVICDRYIQDTLVNELFFHLDYLDKRTLQQLTRSWIKRMPAPDLTVHLDVPAHIAIKRKSDIPSERYITEKKALYRAINQTILLSVPGYERILPISGAQTVGDITEIVYSDIITLLGDR